MAADELHRAGHVNLADETALHLKEVSLMGPSG